MTKLEQPSLRDILNELATDTHTDLETRIAYTEGEILRLITTAKPEKRDTFPSNGNPDGRCNMLYNTALDAYEAALLARLKGQA
jgi:hypothetical protein